MTKFGMMQNIFDYNSNHTKNSRYLYFKLTLNSLLFYRVINDNS